jgi:hypothetical protein
LQEDPAVEEQEGEQEQEGNEEEEEEEVEYYEEEEEEEGVTTEAGVTEASPPFIQSIFGFFWIFQSLTSECGLAKDILRPIEISVKLRIF